MSCPEFEGRLNDYADGELNAGERTEVDNHLARCAACRVELNELRSLVAEVRALPREVEPPPDVWLDTAETIRGRSADGVRPFRFPGLPGWLTPARLVAMAAGIIVLAGAAAALLLQLPQGSPAPGGAVAGAPAPSGTEPGTAVLAGSGGLLPDIRAAEEAFNAAAGNLLELLESRREEIPPETMQVLEESLRSINQAIADAREALQRDPSNAHLGHVVTAMHQMRMDLLRGAARLPAPV
jgi:hypothetical protein